MKQIITTFFALLMAFSLWAQAPQAFNYQAVVRDADGNLLVNQAVGIKISLLQDGAAGQEVYAETHAVTTNQFGQVDLKIGTGTVLTGQFDTISWNTGNYHLQLSVDLSGGANYQIMGTTQMLSVPYALYAEEGSGWEKVEEGISYLGGKVGIGTNILNSSQTQLQIKVEDPYIGGFRLANTDTTNNAAALFRVDANSNLQNAFRIQRNGQIGIGIEPDLARLHLSGSGDRDAIIRLTNTDTGGGDWSIISTNDTWSAGPSRLLFTTGYPQSSNSKMTITNEGRIGIKTNDPITTLHVRAGSSGYTSTNLEGLFVENQGVSNSSFVFQTATAGGGKSFVVTNAGNVGIGTLTVTYPLTVNGTIRSKKVIVDTGWSDFVFEDDYSLMPLHSLAKFIEKNNHLPEMPTAKEVEENGISLGEMDAKLLQKIEELTLYTIEQQSMIDELVKQNEEMGKRLKKIERRKK